MDHSAKGGKVRESISDIGFLTLRDDSLIPTNMTPCPFIS